MTKKIFVVDWYEFEKNWGSRPNGYSLHTTKEICNHYMHERVMNFSDYHSDDPTEPYHIAVSKALYDSIEANGGTLVTDRKIW